MENSEFSGNSETSENLFSEVFDSEFPIWHYTQHRKLGLKTSECSLRHFDQTPRFSNSEFSILHYTQNGKLGVERNPPPPPPLNPPLNKTNKITTTSAKDSESRRGGKLGVLGKLGNLGESVFRGFSLRVSHLALYPTPKTRVENLGVFSEAL